MNVNSTISEYEQFCNWTYTLHQLSENEWHSPIKEAKASIAEIIAHLRNWDLHLIDAVIPSIKKGEGMKFSDFDSFNSKAYQYANSGVWKNNFSMNSQAKE